MRVVLLFTAITSFLACTSANTEDLRERDAGATDARASDDAAGLDAAELDAAGLDAAGLDAAGLDARGGVGSACSVPLDCEAGLTCNTEAPGGYCMPGAPGGPTACREPDVPCPRGTVCSPLPYHAISGVCLKSCTTELDCRPNYRCDIVELFPGDPNSPASASPACWTACQVGADQSCNDDPTTSALFGRCEDGVCVCSEGHAVNPDTGRCR